MEASHALGTQHPTLPLNPPTYFARPRHYTVRARTYAWMDSFGDGTAPCLSVHGHWLENAGFRVGASVSVEATVGQLIITLVEFPSSTQQRHSSEFERHIAKLASARLATT